MYTNGVKLVFFVTTDTENNQQDIPYCQNLVVRNGCEEFIGLL